MRPFLPFLPILPILHCRGAKPAAAKPEVAKPTASKADYGRPRQTIADQGRLQQTKADHGRPKHFEISGATSISDAFISYTSCNWCMKYTYCTMRDECIMGAKGAAQYNYQSSHKAQCAMHKKVEKICGIRRIFFYLCILSPYLENLHKYSQHLFIDQPSLI